MSGVKRKAAQQGKLCYVGLVEKKVKDNYHVICEDVEKKYGADPIITPESKASNIRVCDWVAFMLGNKKVNGRPLAVDVERTDPPGEQGEDDEGEDVVESLEEPLEEEVSQPAKKQKVAAKPPNMAKTNGVQKGAAPFERCFLPADWAPPQQMNAEAIRQTLEVKVEDPKDEESLAPIELYEELEIVPAEVMEALTDMGITSPMPIQAQALPLAMMGRNVIGIAKTGSGKTIAFLLPAIIHIQAQEPVKPGQMTPVALVLAPTRELALQISQEAAKLTSHLEDIKAAVMFGGGDKWQQLDQLRQGASILAATPGRLCDVLQSGGGVNLKRVTYFVLDEADRMLEFGFEDQVMDICRQVRKDRQMLFFSATWPIAVQQLAETLCSDDPVRIVVGQHEGKKATTREDITQEIVIFDDPDWEKRDVQKQALLYEHLREVLQAPEHKCLVFVSQKVLADALRDNLRNEGFLTDSMHGGKSQDARLAALERFKKNEVKLLVATDVMGRGLDISGISHCVIYDMGDVEDYVHRIGRTARGPYGKGHALGFFEYQSKFPYIAEDLVQVLEDSGQDVPDDLRTIAQEVKDGKREAKPMVKKYSAAQKMRDALAASAGDPFARFKKQQQQGDEWGSTNKKKAKTSDNSWGSDDSSQTVGGMFGGMPRTPMEMMMSMYGMGGGGAAKKAGGGGGGKDKDINNIPAQLKVWIGGLSKGTDWKHLKKHFDQIGRTTWVESIGRNQGVVAYSSEDEVAMAIGTLNGSMLNGSPIQVDVWTSK